MDEIVCSFCGVELPEETQVYGITSGYVDEACCGFRIDTDSDWDIYCSDCMNTIDKLIANYKKDKKL
ncbi:hypothetical protein [Trichlorobacter lovleyi]|uniref:hypothetical protein n=1 Tax=Trichlorobacter lovleyi TaxID=313985 RepID=UPI002480DBD6|nr:hypothetical protein [Trichlorobacter lovleyi]